MHFISIYLKNKHVSDDNLGPVRLDLFRAATDLGHYRFIFFSALRKQTFTTRHQGKQERFLRSVQYESFAHILYANSFKSVHNEIQPVHNEIDLRARFWYIFMG